MGCFQNYVSIRQVDPVKLKYKGSAGQTFLREPPIHFFHSLTVWISVDSPIRTTIRRPLTSHFFSSKKRYAAFTPL